MHIVIGGGPAGFMAAVTARRTDPSTPVVLLEAGRQVLRKVRVSGGGRCNVTHDCDDPARLVTNYPRGTRELRGPFTKFGPAAVADWFAAEGVALKSEPDGRRFPVTDRSASVVDALTAAAHGAGVEVRTGVHVTALRAVEGGFAVETGGGATLDARRVVLATGGATSAGSGPSGFDLAQSLGHEIVPPVPSLFTFTCRTALLKGLAGRSATVRLAAAGHASEGPLLVTHRGVSGPAVLKLSALGARDLHDAGYRFELRVDWLPDTSDADALLRKQIDTHGRRQVAGDHPSSLPRLLWAALVREAGVADAARWADLGRDPRRRLAALLKETVLPVTGQTAFKEEFVTCGGVALGEVDFRTMASRVQPGLHLAGEVLDVDGVTGGFNFQACWTTGWLAGNALGDRE
ncbi:MAG: NAD(P)/FAD-dependent oxidoreductase [bacterium]|nr:NAD(P)/FAD-dependent oxidoreductase [bacterium]